MHGTKNLEFCMQRLVLWKALVERHAKNTHAKSRLTMFLRCCFSKSLTTKWSRELNSSILVVFFFAQKDVVLGLLWRRAPAEICFYMYFSTVMKSITALTFTLVLDISFCSSILAKYHAKTSTLKWSEAFYRMLKDCV